MKQILKLLFSAIVAISFMFIITVFNRVNYDMISYILGGLQVAVTIVGIYIIDNKFYDRH